MFFTTYRLANSLPKLVPEALLAEAREWMEQHASLPDLQIVGYKRLFAGIDKYLDKSLSSGPLYLCKPKAATIVMMHVDWGAADGRYQLHRFCVMPNHVHVLFEPMAHDFDLNHGEITWEGYITRKAAASRVEPDRQECLSYCGCEFFSRIRHSCLSRRALARR